ncbi:Programmed cell death 6-interacting protein, partial [Exaiptasia diaphana]
LSSSAYEKICLLFNIGALQSQIASAQNLNSEDGVKLAAKMFQNASGSFQMLKDMVFPQLHQVPTPDLSLEMLNALSSVMLAQGQESIWHKTENDKMKSAIIAKVAAQTSDLYREAHQACEVTNVKQQLEKASRLMDEEERQDTQLRERFKQKWTPKPSADLTAQLREEAAKYRGILENAVRADGIVREKYNSHRRAMDVLCKGE